MREKKHDQPRLGTVENYRHFWMISVWVVYFIIFYIAEHVVTGNYYPVHIPLDDVIPFCEWFIFPYCLWHWLLAIVGVYLLLWDAENFKRFTAFIGIGFIPVMLFDIAFPNGQDLRPLVFERQNIATWLVARIYAADTNTNVFPSMHVIGSAALYAATLYTPSIRKRGLDWVMLPLAVLISISTVFVKQHSILDVFAALALSLVLYLIIYVAARTGRSRRETEQRNG